MYILYIVRVLVVICVRVWAPRHPTHFVIECLYTYMCMYLLVVLVLGPGFLFSLSLRPLAIYTYMYMYVVCYTHVFSCTVQSVHLVLVLYMYIYMYMYIGYIVQDLHHMFMYNVLYIVSVHCVCVCSVHLYMYTCTLYGSLTDVHFLRRHHLLMLSEVLWSSYFNHCTR